MAETTFELKDPFTFGTREVKELTFKELKAKDMRTFKPQMAFGDFLDVAGRLTGEPKSVIDLLSARDTMAVIEHLGNSLTIGEQTS